VLALINQSSSHLDAANLLPASLQRQHRRRQQHLVAALKRIVLCIVSPYSPESCVHLSPKAEARPPAETSSSYPLVQRKGVGSGPYCSTMNDLPHDIADSAPGPTEYAPAPTIRRPYTQYDRYSTQLSGAVAGSAQLTPLAPHASQPGSRARAGHEGRGATRAHTGFLSVAKVPGFQNHRPRAIPHRHSTWVHVYDLHAYGIPVQMIPGLWNEIIGD
jgi:hypothetical protein